MKPLKFDISLTVLNHLGRNLYRSFATVLGEAVSNAWDAEAENVHITYNQEDRCMCIIDDGFGMNRDDLQEKFLKIGYTKRDKLGLFSLNKKRHHIGRKGIGKLALLSCADQVVILSKMENEEWNGVVIDNSEIDQEIKKGTGVAKFELKEPDLNAYNSICTTSKKGTIICFERLKEEQGHTEEFLRKIIALYFRFSLIDPGFKIFLNGNEVTINALADLADKTQFVWNINNYDNVDPFLEMIKPACEAIALTTNSTEIRGFIASVKKPTNRNIFGAKERIGIDLFVNGRMRELDILKHFPSSQVPEEYLYGQIHIDSLDSDSDIDRSTSSRESMQADDPTYKKYLGEIKILVSKIMDQWDELRDKYGYDNDPNNTKRESSRIKKAKSLYREVAKDFIGKASEEGENDEFIKDLTNDAAFNSSSYMQCFVSENIVRKHIKDNGLRPTACCKMRKIGKACVDIYPGEIVKWCQYCKGEKGKQTLQEQKMVAKTSIKIRSAENDVLMYLDYLDLANIINNKILKKEDDPYKPLRNSVMHTSRLTEEAKTKLTSVFDNIVATVKKLLEESAGRV